MVIYDVRENIAELKTLSSVRPIASVYSGTFYFRTLYVGVVIYIYAYFNCKLDFCKRCRGDRYSQ